MPLMRQASALVLRGWPGLHLTASFDVQTKSVSRPPQFEQRNFRWISRTSPRQASISACRSDVPLAITRAPLDAAKGGTADGR